MAKKKSTPQSRRSCAEPEPCAEALMLKGYLRLTARIPRRSASTSSPQDSSRGNRSKGKNPIENFLIPRDCAGGKSDLRHFVILAQTRSRGQQFCTIDIAQGFELIAVPPFLSPRHEQRPTPINFILTWTFQVDTLTFIFACLGHSFQGT